MPIKTVPAQTFHDVWSDFTPDENRLYEDYSGTKTLLTELNSVGWLRFKAPLLNALYPNRHKNWVEIIYMAHGQVDRWIEDSSYTFSAGNVLIISPNQIHGAACGVMQPCEHYWMRFRFPAKKIIPGLSMDQQKRLKAFFNAPPERMLRCPSSVKSGFLQLLAAHRNRTPLADVAARCAFLSILCAIADESKNSTISPAQSSLSPKIRNSIQSLHICLDNPPSVKEMAKMAHMSMGTFRVLFEKETGTPPNNYITIQRVREAKKLLRSGRSVTDTAHALGFSSSQYFATVFKKWAGITPSDYLSKLAAEE